jgi:hypothetical protein
MTVLPAELTQPASMKAHCPSCAQTGEFTLLGIQRFPAKIAIAAGLPESFGLYRCEHCDTSISEVELNNVRR